MTGLISPLDMAPDDIPVPGDTTNPGATAEDAETGGNPDLHAVRALVLQAHPDIVPELVTGESITDLIASVEPARAAYARVADALAQTRPVAAPVPAGGGTPIVVDPDKVPAAEKIRRGLATAIAKKG